MGYTLNPNEEPLGIVLVRIATGFAPKDSMVVAFAVTFHRILNPTKLVQPKKERQQKLLGGSWVFISGGYK